MIAESFQQSIESLTQDIEVIGQINIIPELENLDSAGLSDSLRINVYRIIQEQLNNILKYAEASEVKITSAIQKDKLILSVTDNGKGFDTSEARTGVGMINIQNRAELFNGKAEVISSPGNGCKLQVTLDIIPVNSQKAA